MVLAKAHIILVHLAEPTFEHLLRMELPMLVVQEPQTLAAVVVVLLEELMELLQHLLLAVLVVQVMQQLLIGHKEKT